MKAILASSDITKIAGGAALVEKMTGKPRAQINIAIINEASAVEFAHHRWAIDTMTSLAANFGGDIEIVHLLAIPLDKAIERIAVADMLAVLGGNVDWLKVVFDRTGFSKVLPEILKDKLYHGSSAGAMILGHRPSVQVQTALYGEEQTFGVTNYLDLVNLSILPHFNSTDMPDINARLVRLESKSVDYPIYALSDNAAVVVDGKNISVIGSDYIKLIGGKQGE